MPVLRRRTLATGLLAGALLSLPAPGRARHRGRPCRGLPISRASSCAGTPPWWKRCDAPASGRCGPRARWPWCTPPCSTRGPPTTRSPSACTGTGTCGGRTPSATRRTPRRRQPGRLPHARRPLPHADGRPLRSAAARPRTGRHCHRRRHDTGPGSAAAAPHSCWPCGTPTARISSASWAPARMPTTPAMPPSIRRTCSAIRTAGSRCAPPTARCSRSSRRSGGS